MLCCNNSINSDVLIISMDLIDCSYSDDMLLDKEAEKQMILEELSTVYHSTIEPLESLYQYDVLGVNSFTGILNYFLVTEIIINYVYVQRETVFQYYLHLVWYELYEYARHCT